MITSVACSQLQWCFVHSLPFFVRRKKLLRLLKSSKPSQTCCSSQLVNSPDKWFIGTLVVNTTVNNMLFSSRIEKLPLTIFSLIDWPINRMTSRASFSRGNKFEDWWLQWIVGIQTMPHAANPSSGTKSLCPLEQVWTNLFLEWAHLSCATEEGEKMHHFCESFSKAETHKTHIHTTTASVQTTADYLWSSLPKTRCTLVSHEALQLV